MITERTFPSLSNAAATMTVSTCAVAPFSGSTSFDLAIDVTNPRPILANPVAAGVVGAAVGAAVGAVVGVVGVFAPHPASTPRARTADKTIDIVFFMFP